MQPAIKIDFENYFQTRPYQRPFFRAALVEGYKRFLSVIHRRAGKDTQAWNLCWPLALIEPGLYYFLLPKVKQSRAVIWKGRGKDGIRFLDRIPQYLINNKHETYQTIELINGSIIQVTGGDNYDGIVGTNPRWAFLSEAQNMNPMLWDLILRPILSENGGGAALFGTPRGHNHFYDLFMNVKTNQDWFVQFLTADDTTYDDGRPVISKEAIQAERDAGMPEDLIQQEYYCSFEAAIRGAYFTEEVKRLRDEKRLTTFPVDANIPVHTGWDIGMRDATAICLYQVHSTSDIRCIYYLENSGKGAEWYVMELMKLKSQLGFKKFGHHFLPHDVAVREWGTGRTRIEILKSAGIQPRLVKISRNAKAERIQCIRALMPKLWLHEANCKNLERALVEYHAAYDEKKGIYSKEPEHNWASHAVDAHGTFAMGYHDIYDQPWLMQQKKYASFMPLN